VDGLAGDSWFEFHSIHFPAKVYTLDFKAALVDIAILRSTQVFVTLRSSEMACPLILFFASYFLHLSYVINYLFHYHHCCVFKIRIRLV
jgi:hypothetical protein